MINLRDLIIWFDANINCPGRLCEDCHKTFRSNRCPNVAYKEAGRSAMEAVEKYLDSTGQKEISYEDFVRVLNEN